MWLNTDLSHLVGCGHLTCNKVYAFQCLLHQVRISIPSLPHTTVTYQGGVIAASSTICAECCWCCVFFIFVVRCQSVPLVFSDLWKFQTQHTRQRPHKTNPYPPWHVMGWSRTTTYVDSDNWGHYWQDSHAIRRYYIFSCNRYCYRSYRHDFHHIQLEHA